MGSGKRAVAIGATVVCIAVALAGQAHASLTFLTKWGSSGSGDGQFLVPQALTVDGAGNVYVVDQNNNRIQKFTADGGFILKWGSFGSSNTQLGSPQGLALDSAGNVYVIDSGNYRVQKFTSDGQFLQTIGAGQFASNPHYGAFGPNGDLYVTESSQVHEFDSAGTQVRTWGSSGTGPGQFTNARGIAVDAAGNVYVADASASRVQKFSATGQLLSQFGSFGRGPGQFASPLNLAIAPNGHIFVADNNGVVEFAADGTWIERNEMAGSENFQPQGIAFNGAGDLYISDNQANTGNRVLKVHPTAAPPPPAALPSPAQGSTVNALVDSGVVLVKPPPGAAPRRGAHAAATGFVPLGGLGRQIPVGSTVDTTRGQVHLIAATNARGGTQDGHFSKGVFIVQQAKTNPLTTVSMTGGNLNRCSKLPRGGAAKQVAAAARRGRSLFANVRGRFRTRGRNSTATVRGTEFLVKDSCAGTLTTVVKGSVTVRDFTRRKNIVVPAHHKYLARAPKRRH